MIIPLFNPSDSSLWSERTPLKDHPSHITTGVQDRTLAVHSVGDPSTRYADKAWGEHTHRHLPPPPLRDAGVPWVCGTFVQGPASR